MVRWIQRGLDFVPVTLLGWMVTGCAAFALKVFAYGKVDLVFLVVGYAALGLVVLAAVAVSMSAIRLKIALARAPLQELLRLETNQPLSTSFSIPSFHLVPLVQVRWKWIEPKHVHVSSERKNGALTEYVAFEERGEHTHVRRKIFVEDAFGVARIGLHHESALKIRVLPHSGGMRQLPVLVSLATGDGWPHPMGLEDGDRMDLRRYGPGDPARFIHWKVFGRTRKLVVRVPERAVSPARRTAAYVVAGEHDDASCAAARVAVETGGLGEQWTFCADGANEDVDTAEQAIPQIVRSIAARADGGKGLGNFITRVQKKGPAKMIVFAPPRSGAWIDHVLSAARRTVGRIKIVIGVDGIVDTAPQSRLSKWIWRRPERNGTPLGEVEEVLRRLGTSCDIVVVDRKSGKILGEGHRWALRHKQENKTPALGVRQKDLYADA